ATRRRRSDGGAYGLSLCADALEQVELLPEQSGCVRLVGHEALPASFFRPATIFSRPSTASPRAMRYEAASCETSRRRCLSRAISSATFPGITLTPPGSLGGVAFGSSFGELLMPEPSRRRPERPLASSPPSSAPQ